MKNDNKLSSSKIILFGQLMVNIPVILISVLVIFLAIVMNIGWIPTAILASGIGWYAWGKLIEKWKFWALSQGVERERLFKLGKIGLINFYKHKIFIDQDESKSRNNDL